MSCVPCLGTVFWTIRISRLSVAGLKELYCNVETHRCWLFFYLPLWVYNAYLAKHMCSNLYWFRKKKCYETKWFYDVPWYFTHIVWNNTVFIIIMESVSVDLSKWAFWRPWLCGGMYSMGCCRKEIQKDRNKYVITPWRWNLMVAFLSLTFTLVFTVCPMAQRSWGLPKKNTHTVFSLHYCPITTNILKSYGMFVVSLWIFTKITPLGAEIEQKIYYGLHVKSP